MNVDSPLFIDPILLEKSNIPIIKTEAYEVFRTHFSRIIRLLLISKKEGDAPWRAARQQLNLREPPENGLGYGSGDRPGTSRPDTIRETILRTTKEIIELGASDPEMISLIGFSEENVGPDTISDFTTRVIAPQLALITHNLCKEASIPTKISALTSDIALPHYKNTKGQERAIMLVPRDIVRELPAANSWSDIEQAANANAAIRARVNAFLAGIVKPTVSDRKAAVRFATLESAQLFELFIAAVKEHSTYYDPNHDALGYYKLKDIISSDKYTFKSTRTYNLSEGVQEVRNVVTDTIKMFKHHVENGNLWEEL
ncbi:hypothetical protein [Microvirga sp.]|uniref:hypothetical protein n=1 Tax=Microvirga sp. TaxID=1873136 RepID=UPI001AEDCB7F|nr:hypothetical protein [Microvirga sp.]